MQHCAEHTLVRLDSARAHPCRVGLRHNGRVPFYQNCAEPTLVGLDCATIMFRHKGIFWLMVEPTIVAESNQTGVGSAIGMLCSYFLILTFPQQMNCFATFLEMKMLD